MLKGGCLCGAVRYEVEGRSSAIWLCHCSKCRKGSGSAFAASTLCRLEAFRWVSGEEEIVRYRTESGYPCRFCRICGAKLPLVLEQAGQVVLPAGAVSGEPVPKLHHHIFVGSKAPWWEIADDLPCFEEHEPA